MTKAWYGRLTLLAIATVWAVIYLLPTLLPAAKLPPWFARQFEKKIQLGLDLQGGIHLVYEVQVDKAVSDKVDRFAADIEEKLKKERKLAFVAERKGRDEIVLRTKVPADAAKIDKDALGEFLSNLEEVARDPKAGAVTLRIDPAYVAEVKDYAVRQAIETIRGRVDKFGVAEPSIIRRGEDIVVELPGLSDSDFERVKSIIGRTAQLEFKMIDDEADYMSRVAPRVPKDDPLIKVEVDAYDGLQRGSVREIALRSKSKDAVDQFFASLPKEDRPPDTHQVLYSEVQAQDEKGNELPDKEWRTFYVKRRAELTGEYIADAQVMFDQQTGRPEVSIRFDRSGAEIFERISGENVGRKMAIVLDEKVNSAPVIQSRISGGTARITLGGFRDPFAMQQEAKDLVAVLRSGALPAPLKKVFETQVGPTLGRDAIDQGTRAALLAAAFLAFAIIFYYRVTGLVSVLGVAFNVLFVLAIMAGFEAALTLPGIAGLLLTNAMSVDSNVIINERIREELRAGKSPRAAVEAGYARAFWTIWDSQLTTAIGGFVLLQYGSGPLRGFAITLLIGIACSVFTGIYVTRIFMDWIVDGLRVQKLSV
ncbi:MAG: protein translocase subunit SecD [Myxococcota bacterium]